MKRQQIVEWTENPVTLSLKALLQREIEERSEQEVFVPFEPHKTQELLAGMNGEVVSLERVIEYLEGDMEAEDE